MSLPTLANQLRQKIATILAAPFSFTAAASVSNSNNSATAADQLHARSKQQRHENRKRQAWLLWAKVRDVDRGISSSSSQDILSLNNRAHLGFITKQNYKAPRDPVVLCHGLFGFDVLGPEALPALQIHYWKGIADALKDIGCKVHVSRVGTVAALKTRAHELRSFLESKTDRQSINLISHSMGGLDCRYVITHLPSSKFKVNSLTTVATPHRGSSFMDWCRDAFGVGHLHDYIHKQMDDVVAKYINEHSKHSSSSAPSPPTPAATSMMRTHPLIRALFTPFDSPAFANLTLDYCSAFNLVTPDDPSVSYMSYAAVSNVSPLSPLYFSHRIISQREGVNDGLVSLESAKWGEFLGTLPCDHWQLIPPKVPVRGHGFDSVGFYLGVVTGLADRGF